MVYKNRTKFQKWVIQNNKEVMRECRVTYAAVHHWHSGKTTPRLEHALKIEQLSERQITLADIYPALYKMD